MSEEEPRAKVMKYLMVILAPLAVILVTLSAAYSPFGLSIPVLLFGGGFAFVIFFSLLYAVLVRKNIHG